MIQPDGLVKAYNLLLNCFFKCLWRKRIGKILKKWPVTVTEHLMLMALCIYITYITIFVIHWYFSIFCSFSCSVLQVVLCILTTEYNIWTAACIPESPCPHAHGHIYIQPSTVGRKERRQERDAMSQGNGIHSDTYQEDRKNRINRKNENATA